MKKMPKNEALWEKKLLYDAIRKPIPPPCFPHKRKDKTLPRKAKHKGDTNEG